jgi:hypothetical protein
MREVFGGHERKLVIGFPRCLQMIRVSSIFFEAPDGFTDVVVSRRVYETEDGKV